jgi:hypothetical protein
MLGNDPTLRGLHPCISHRYPTVPFRDARRTDAVTGGPSRGLQPPSEIAPALTVGQGVQWSADRAQAWEVQDGQPGRSISQEEAAQIAARIGLPVP